MTSIADRLNRDVTSWKPAPGDVVEGRLIDVEVHEGKFGNYPLVTIETPAGDVVAIHAFHTVLRCGLARKRPVPGDMVAIKFVGVEPGKSYASYKLVVERTTPAPAIDYDAMAAEPLPDEPPDDYDEF